MTHPLRIDPRMLRSSRLPHSAPGEWKEGQALRECVLAGFPESHVKMLREIFPALFTIYSEEGVLIEPSYCGSPTKGHLRAVMQDLRFTARYLAMVARMGLDEAGERNQELVWFSDRLAVRVEKLADLIEAKIVPKQGRKAAPSHEQA